MTSKDAQSARGQLKKQSLIRARRSGSDDDDADNAYRAVLQIETPLDTVAELRDWDSDEKRIGRRLVRFSRVQEGCTLRVSCEAIKPSDYTDGDTVVSCIYRPTDATGPGDAPVSKCCITSVDISFLLECLVGDIFNIEEKNRIRRNLEGFRPKTVSKNKVGTEEFFQKIMDFPAPKPRNIEKDVKVFDWAVLPQALDKIISKYVSPASPLLPLPGDQLLTLILDFVPCCEEAGQRGELTRRVVHAHDHVAQHVAVLQRYPLLCVILAAAGARLVHAPGRAVVLLLPPAHLSSAPLHPWDVGRTRQLVRHSDGDVLGGYLRRPSPFAFCHSHAVPSHPDTDRLSQPVSGLVHGSPIPLRQRAVPRASTLAVPALVDGARRVRDRGCLLAGP